MAGIGPDGRQLSSEDLKRIPYLECVVKESLRLYPPVPINSRTAIKATTLPAGGGYNGTAPLLVKKGESVSYNLYVLHRRKDIYGNDAEQFVPERWEGDQLGGVGYGYLPFNAGPRTCMGQDRAMFEISYTVARFIQRYPSIAVADDCEMLTIGKERQALNLALFCEDGCRVKLGQAGDGKR